MGLGDLFRKKTYYEKYGSWNKDDVNKFKKDIEGLIPILHKNYSILKEIYDKVTKEAWKRTEWEKKNVTKDKFLFNKTIIKTSRFMPYTPEELKKRKKARQKEEKQKKIDDDFISRCEKKEMMLFEGYASKAKIDLSGYNYKFFKNYFTEQDKFFDTIEKGTGSSFTESIKNRFKNR